MGDDDETLAAAATVVLLRDGMEGVEALLLQRPDHGSFARAWVFPGGKVDPEDAGETPDERAVHAGVRETQEETGLLLEAERIVPLSIWVPPQETSRRFHTWFFVARAPHGEVTINPDEARGHRWLRPADALALHGERALTLFPPTWVTLHGLANAADVDDALSAARLRTPPTFATHHDPIEQRFLWFGDEAYDGADETAHGPRHRLMASTLPWEYLRR